MDASQYKDYILTLLFVKYVTDKHRAAGAGLIEIPPGGSFDDIVALRGRKEIGEQINVIISRLAKANGLEGVIDVADFADDDKLGFGDDMRDRLSELVAIFDNLDFRSNRADGDDLLGDAYEYLMRHFATESGKSKGQFYTPTEVSRILAKVVGVGPETRKSQTIYDPTCGSGSLLLKAADEAQGEVTIYGQEKDLTTWALAKMNMILHGHETADLGRGDTISSPRFLDGDGLKRFDFVVANPPFSTKSWSNGIDPPNDVYERFGSSPPPAKNGDYAFLLHAIKSLKGEGKAAVILPHGVLFRKNVERTIRKDLLDRRLIKGVIGLPPNLFYGTGIPTCIIVIDKAGAAERDEVFIVDASREFSKDRNKSRLRDRDIHKIVDVFNNRVELDRYSRSVPIAEIAGAENDYNLNLSRYIDSSEPDDVQDLDGHLLGGIPDRDVDDLEAYWEVMPRLREELFAAADRPDFSAARHPAAAVPPMIREHSEFRDVAAQIGAIVDAWLAGHRGALFAFERGASPKAMLASIAEDLLERSSAMPILDRYSVYQRFMDYWWEVMQDDLYLVAADGWLAASRPREAIDDKKRKLKERADLVVRKKKYKMDLLPPPLIAGAFFPKELADLALLTERTQAAELAFDELVDEHTGQDGLLEEATTDKGSVTKGSVRDRLRELGDDPAYDEERAVLEQAREVIAALAAARKKEKEATDRLNRQLLERYEQLSDREVAEMVVDHKWIASIRHHLEVLVADEAERLAARIVRLETRYESTLQQLEEAVESAAARVDGHLAEMGFATR